MSVVLNDKRHSINVFIDDSGGTGKAFLYNILIRSFMVQTAIAPCPQVAEPSRQSLAPDVAFVLWVLETCERPKFYENTSSVSVRTVYMLPGDSPL